VLIHLDPIQESVAIAVRRGRIGIVLVFLEGGQPIEIAVGGGVEISTVAPFPPLGQAISVGISRAVEQAEREKVAALIKKYS